MQPAQGDVGGGSRMLRRWGPIAAIVVVVAVVAGVLVLSGGDDEEPTGSGEDNANQAEPVEGVVTFSQAEEQGIEVDWPDTCDTETGQIAIPTNYRAECVAPFEGDNGGATSNGVTADSIKVVVYQSPPDPLTDAIFQLLNVDDTADQAFETQQGFVDLYSAYYETYGREVELIRFQGTATSIDEVAARSDAQTIVEQYDPFMVWGGPLLTDAFADELAANGVLNISLTATMADQYYEDRDPSLWTILMTPEQNMRHVAEYVGKRLAGRPAEHAGDAELVDQERVFGLVSMEIGPDFDYLHQTLVDEAAEYGVEFAADVTYTDPVTLPTVAAQKVAELKEAGVTTVVFVGDPLAPKTFTEEATRQELFPEWVVTGSYLVDSTAFARTYDQEQWSHAFGMSGLWARGLPEASFAYHLYEWFHGEPPPADDSVAILFPSPTQLFAGINLAGPNLTPETFRAALFSAMPIPGGLSNPGVSWGDHGLWPSPDYAALDDMTELWWDPEATGPDERGDEGQGMYQYVDGGVRYLPGEWPETPPKVFDPDGAVSLYTELPESDASDDYPPPER